MSIQPPPTWEPDVSPIRSEREVPPSLRPPAALGSSADQEPESDSLRLLTTRMVSLRFVRAALRRNRWAWLMLAVLGLVIGAGYHVAVPMKYSATATVYLSHPSGSNATAEVQNDLAMLETPSVGNRAIALLGAQGHGLTSSKLLGKAPGTVVSGNVLDITIWGSSSGQAVLRANAVARAFLAFRAQAFEAENQAVVAAADQQVAKLQAQITTLNAQISTSRSSPAQLASLESQRAAATSDITSLQQSVQQDDLNTLSIVKGTRILSPGTPVATSKRKVFILDGLTGLVAGLAVGLLGVIVLAVASERLRSREDIAAVLGAPVGLSLEKVPRRARRPRSLRSVRSAARPQLRVFSEFLRDHLDNGHRLSTELVVAVDDVYFPAAALVGLAHELASEGKFVALADSTASRVLARSMGAVEIGPKRRGSEDGWPVTLVEPPKPWEAELDGGEQPGIELPPATDVVLVLATVDPAVGAWHLRNWGSEAIVTVTAGASTARRIGVVAELLEEAGITVVSAVLLDADADDESVGLPLSTGASSRGRLGLVGTAPAMSR
jgi:capsular polysaccharide biosynthesis protein